MGTRAPQWPPIARAFAPAVAIVLLWVASLALPALAAGGRVFTGWEMLVDGWQGLSRGVYAWLANPLFIAASIAALAARHVAAGALSAAALLVGATSAFVESALRARMSSVPEIELRLGFYLWMLAFAAPCLHSLTRALSARRRARSKQPARHSTDSVRSRD